MANVFIFPVGDAAAKAGFGVTLEGGYDLEALLPFIGDEPQVENLRRLYPDGKCYIWGVPERGDHFSTWNIMAENDLVLGYRDRSIVSASYVLMKINNPSLAARLWGENTGGPPGLMCFTGRPHAGAVPIVEQMLRYLDREYEGFTKVDSKKSDHMAGDYGSLETFVRLALGYDFPFSFRHSE